MSRAEWRPTTALAVIRMPRLDVVTGNAWLVHATDRRGTHVVASFKSEVQALGYAACRRCECRIPEIEGECRACGVLDGIGCTCDACNRPKLYECAQCGVGDKFSTPCGGEVTCQVCGQFCTADPIACPACGNSTDGGACGSFDGYDCPAFAGGREQR